MSEIDLPRLKGIVHARILDGASAHSHDPQAIGTIVDDVAPLLSAPDRHSVVQGVLSDVDGFGGLDCLLGDDSITDVMVLGDRNVWIERRGELLETDINLGVREVERLMERICGPLGLHIDRAHPLVDARLPDGSRVHMAIPPAAVDGPALTIRRFGTRAITLDQFAPGSSLTILVAAVRNRKNILISGATGSGKTTLLNALAFHVDRSDRIVTIEDTAELRLRLPHVIRLEARIANSEGVGEITMRQLVRNALRMRPDRIVVGEVRGHEAFDMLQALYTGHKGSMATCHAGSASDALRRVETMVLMSDVALTPHSIRRQIASAIDLVVHVSRGGDGSRTVETIEEVCADRDDMSTNSLWSRI